MQKPPTSLVSSLVSPEDVLAIFKRKVPLPHLTFPLFHLFRSPLISLSFATFIFLTLFIFRLSLPRRWYLHVKVPLYALLCAKIFWHVQKSLLVVGEVGAVCLKGGTIREGVLVNLGIPLNLDTAPLTTSLTCPLSPHHNNSLDGFISLLHFYPRPTLLTDLTALLIFTLHMKYLWLMKTLHLNRRSLWMHCTFPIDLTVLLVFIKNTLNIALYLLIIVNGILAFRAGAVLLSMKHLPVGPMAQNISHVTHVQGLLLSLLAVVCLPMFFEGVWGVILYVYRWMRRLILVMR